MKPILYVYILLAIALLILLWLFSLKTRRGQRKLQVPKQYRYAHRGLHNARRGIPENSILSYRYVLAGGFGADQGQAPGGDPRQRPAPPLRR